MEPQEQNNTKRPQQQPLEPQGATERRSIRDLRISRPQPRKAERIDQPQRTQRRLAPEPSPVTQNTRQSTGNGKSSKFLIPGLAVGLGVLLLFVLLPVIFPDATVKVVPKVADGLPKTTVVASFAPDSAIPYTVTSWSKEATTKIPTTKTVTVADKASGKIEIHNTNTSEQKLIKNTRFESANGKVYRIRDSVVVPAGKKSGSDITPGVLVTTVYADEGGESFNLTSGEFTLPGLKGSDLFKKVTAKTSTAITGGFTGEKKTADESVVAKARIDLRKQLEDEAALPDTTTPASIALVNTMKKSFESLPDTNEADSLVVTERVMFQVITVPTNKFAYALASEAGSHIESTDVGISNMNDITISSPSTSLDAALSKKELTITVDGVPHLVWNIDIAQLKKDLAGASRDEVTTIQKRYTNIEKAVTTIRPFWRNTLPSNAERIQVTIENATPTE